MSLENNIVSMLVPFKKTGFKSLDEYCMYTQGSAKRERLS